MILDSITLEGLRSFAPTLYGGGFLLFALWEVASPRRESSVSSSVRWLNNLAIFVLGSGLLYAVLPTLVIGMAAVVESEGVGLLNRLGYSGVVVIVLSILAIDLLRYCEHRLLHGLPLLWRLHRMHHADLDFDVATGLRTHPFEILFSAGFRITVIALLGIPLAAVIIAEVLIVASNFFIHANIRLPGVMDRCLRTVVVTPDFHRVHHSSIFEEGNSNYANIFTFWDRLFGTCVEQPGRGHVGMTIGLEAYRDQKHALLHWMLINPFLPDTTSDGRLPADPAVAGNAGPTSMPAATGD